MPESEKPSLSRSGGSAAIAGALSVVIVWAMSLANVDVPAEVAAAFTTILATATSFIVKD